MHTKKSIQTFSTGRGFSMSQTSIMCPMGSKLNLFCGPFLSLTGRAGVHFSVCLWWLLLLLCIVSSCWCLSSTDDMNSRKESGSIYQLRWPPVIPTSRHSCPWQIEDDGNDLDDDLDDNTNVSFPVSVNKRLSFSSWILLVPSLCRKPAAVLWR